MIDQVEWQEVRVKYLFDEIDERAGDQRRPLLAVSIHRGVVPRESLTVDEPRADDLAIYKLCNAGDIVLNRMRAFQGAIGVSFLPGIVSPDYLVLRPRTESCTRFMHYLFRSLSFIGEMQSRLRGIGSVGRGNVRTPRINPDDLRDIRVRVPPRRVQSRIANFLDTETGRIDALISKKRRLVRLLDERETALIDHHLDSFAGSYGSHSFARWIRRIEQGSSPQCDSLPAEADEWGVLKVSSVKDGRFWADENKRLPDDLTPEPRFAIKSTDLLVTRANTPALVGAVCVVPDDLDRRLLLCDKIFRIDVADSLDKDFAVLVSRSTRIRDWCACLSHGTSQSMANLKAEDIKSWPIPAAPLPVQRETAATVADALDRFERLRSGLRNQLGLLRDHRDALITATVTGEIDVPGVKE